MRKSLFSENKEEDLKVEATHENHLLINFYSYVFLQFRPS